ncbi:MAG: dipeptidase [Thermodesulfobacteriota bacterium]|nr:dipeptidase [Thermodesulfobacteriota bacterium]
MTDPKELERKTSEIHRRSIVVDGHCHLTKELIGKRDQSERQLFKKYYLPLFDRVGLQVLLLIIGGDNNANVKGSDLMLWGALEVIDYVYQELEECSDVVKLCTRPSDIDETLKDGKVAIMLGLEGGRPLEGRPMHDSLSTLRAFHRLGVRSLQLTGNGRNRLADGIAEARTKGGLTQFGVAVAKEMNRLGMIIDISHLSPAGVIDVLSVSEGPIIASHSNAKAICDHPRNLTDEIIRKIAEREGIVGLSFFSTLINKDKDLPTVEDLVDHVDHIANLVGIDYVGLGPDFSEFSIRISQWSGPRGDMEGVQYGNKENYFHPELRDWSHIPNVTKSLLKRGYSEEAIQKVLGVNFLRFYKRVLKS